MKEIGLAEEYILYELPLARGHAYRHAILRSHGIKTYYFESDEEKLAKGNEVLARLAQIEVDE